MSSLPTSNAGPGILHPRSIATHVASLAQSIVVQGQGLRIVSGANQAASRIGWAESIGTLGGIGWLPALSAHAPYVPYAAASSARSRADQGIGSGTPSSGSLLARQDETAGAGAHELPQPRRDMLAAPPLWIDQGPHRLSEGSRFDRSLAVVHGPSGEQLYDLTAVRIVGLNLIHPFDGIATSKREKRIAAPLGPLFEAAERSTRSEIRRVLSSPAPNSQGCREQIGPTKFDLREKVQFEAPLLRVFAACI